MRLNQIDLSTVVDTKSGRKSPATQIVQKKLFETGFQPLR